MSAPRRGAEAADPSLAAAVRPGPLLLVAAVEFEARGLTRRLGRRGREAGGPILRIAGPRAADLPRLGADLAALDPSAVLVIGLSGGCAPDLRPGDLVVGTTVGSTDGAWLEPDPALLRRTRAALATARLPHRLGRLLTVDEVMATPAAKADCWTRHGALAVDMESARVLAWSRAAGLPGLAVRAVADGPADALPPALLAAVAPGGGLRPTVLLGWLARPALLAGAWRMWRRSALALDHLARFLAAVAPGRP